MTVKLDYAERTLQLPHGMKYLAEAITLTSEKGAEKSKERLLRQYENAGREKREKIILATRLAWQRAKALQGKNGLSPGDVIELERVSHVYAGLEQELNKQR